MSDAKRDRMHKTPSSVTRDALSLLRCLSTLFSAYLCHIWTNGYQRPLWNGSSGNMSADLSCRTNCREVVSSWIVRSCQPHRAISDRRRRATGGPHLTLLLYQVSLIVTPLSLISSTCWTKRVLRRFTLISSTCWTKRVLRRFTLISSTCWTKRVSRRFTLISQNVFRKGESL